MSGARAGLGAGLVTRTAGTLVEPTVARETEHVGRGERRPADSRPRTPAEQDPLHRLAADVERDAALAAEMAAWEEAALADGLGARRRARKRIRPR